MPRPLQLAVKLSFDHCVAVEGDNFAGCRIYVTKFQENTTDQCWSVVDIVTGRAAKYRGVFLAALEADEVNRVVNLLNIGDLAGRGAPKRSFQRSFSSAILPFGTETASVTQPPKFLDSRFAGFLVV